LAVRTSAFKQAKRTGIAAATRAIIATGTRKYLSPAISAQIVVRFGNGFAAVYTDRGPEKMVNPIDHESDGSFHH